MFKDRTCKAAPRNCVTARVTPMAADNNPPPAGASGLLNVSSLSLESRGF